MGPQSNARTQTFPTSTCVHDSHLRWRDCRPSPERSHDFYHARYCHIFSEEERSSISELMYSPPIQALDCGRLYQTATLNGFAARHVQFYICVMKSYITGSGAWAHPSAIVKRARKCETHFRTHAQASCVRVNPVHTGQIYEWRVIIHGIHRGCCWVYISF